MQSLLKDLRSKVEAENHTPQELYADLKKLGVYMFTTNTMNKEMVLGFCSKMLKLYSVLARGGGGHG